MAFNFGAFAGGLSTGIERGMRLSDFLKKARDEQAQKDVIEKATAEAEADRAETASDLAKQGVTTAPAPVSGPIDTSTPKVETPADAQAVSEASPTASPDAAMAKGAASAMAPQQMTAPAEAPTANPDAAAAATAAGNMPKGSQLPLAPSVSTQSPAQVQATPDTKAEASPQQAVVGSGVQSPAATPVQTEANKPKEGEDDRIERINTNIAKRMQQHMISQGNIEGAERWGKWSESARGKKIGMLYAKTTMAPDLDGMVQNGMKLYSYVDDGVDATGYKIVTKADGTETAMVTLKDKTTGKTREMEMTKDSIMRMAGSANPQAMYEHDLKRQDAADTAKLAAKIKEQQRKDNLADNKELEDYKSKNRMEEIGLRAKLKTDLGEDAAARFKKATDPSERAAILDKTFSDPNHPDNKAFKKLDRAGRDQFISDRIKAYEKIGDDFKNKDSASAPSAPPKPVAPVKGVEIITLQQDKNGFKKGQQFQKIDGKYIPVDPVASPSAPAASGLPEKK